MPPCPRPLRTALLAAAVVLGAAASAADQDSVRRGVQTGALKPLAEILGRVQAQHPGRVVDVDLENEDGRSWYEITLLHPDGHRVEVYVDPASGAEIDPRRGQGHGPRPMAEVLRVVAERQPGVVRHAELERPRGAPPVYEVTVERADGSEQRIRVDAASGRIVEQTQRPGALPPTARPLPALVQSIEARYAGRVVELEIKHDARRGTYYEMELALAGGRGLEVDVDPVTARVLQEQAD